MTNVTSDQSILIDGTSVALVNGTDVNPTANNGMEVMVSVTGAGLATVAILKSGGVASSVMQTVVDNMTFTDTTVVNGQSSQDFKFVHYVMAGFIFIALTVPLTRLTDWVARRQGWVNTSLVL